MDNKQIQNQIADYLNDLMPLEILPYEKMISTQEFETLFKFNIYQIIISIDPFFYPNRVRYFLNLKNHFLEERMQGLKNILIIIHDYLNKEDSRVIAEYNKYFNGNFETKEAIIKKVNSIKAILETDIIDSIILNKGLNPIEDWLEWINQYFYFCNELTAPQFRYLSLSEAEMKRFFYSFWSLKDDIEEHLLNIPKSRGIEQFILLNEYKCGNFVLNCENYSRCVYAAKIILRELKKTVLGEYETSDKESLKELMDNDADMTTFSEIEQKKIEGSKKPNKENFSLNTDKSQEIQNITNHEQLKKFLNIDDLEIKIIKLLIEGGSNEEIGKKLKLKKSDVKNFISKIYRNPKILAYDEKGRGSRIKAISTLKPHFEKFKL